MILPLHAMEKLDAQYRRWRMNPNDSRFFIRRKIIIDEVKRLAETDSYTHREAVELLDRYISRNDLSLNKLQNLIKTGGINYEN